MRQIAWKSSIFYLLYSLVALWLNDNAVVPGAVNSILYLAIAGFGFFSIFSSKYSREKFQNVQGYIILFIVYSTYLLASLFLVPDIRGFFGIRDGLLWYFLSILIWWLNPSLHDVRKACRVIGAAITLIAFAGLLGIYFIDLGFIRLYESSDGPSMFRVVATVSNPNTLAMLMQFMIIKVLVELLFEGGKKRILLLLVYISVIFVTLSRAAILFTPVLMILTYGLYLNYTRTKWRTLCLSLIKIGATVIVILFIMVLLGPIILEYVDSREFFVIDRITNNMFNFDVLVGDRANGPWETVLRGASSGGIGEVIWGKGIGSVATKSDIGVEVEVVDSFWLKIFLEQGLIGTSLFLLVIKNIGQRCWFLYRNPTTAQIGIVSLVSLVMTLITCTYATTFDIYPLNVLFWFGVGCIMVIETEVKGTKMIG